MDTLPATDRWMGSGIDISQRIPATYNATQKERDKIEEIRWRRQLADENRQFFAEKAISNQYLWDNVVEKVGDYFTNIAVPWPFIIVQTYVGRAFLELCQDTPYLEVMEDMDSKRVPAKRVQKSINRELYIQDFPFMALLTYRNVFIRGTEWIGYIPWGEFRGMEMPVLYQPNWFRTWVNPNENTLEADDAYIIHDTFMRYDTMMETYGDNPYWIKKALKAVEPLGIDPANMYEDRARAILGIPTKKFDVYSKLVKLTFYWTHRGLAVTANDNILVRNGENPADGKIPFREVWILPDDRSIYKPSLLDIGKDLFAEVNELHCQRIDAANFMLNPHYLAGEAATLKVNKIPYVPGWITKVGGNVDQIKPVPVDWHILGQSLQQEGWSEMAIKRYSNTHEPIRGEPAPGRQTATATMIQEKRGSTQQDIYNFLLNLMTVEKIAEDFNLYHRLFMTDPSPFNDPSAKEQPYAEAEDFEEMFTFRAMGSILGARDMERRDFLGLMNIIFGNPMLAQGALNKIPEWISRAMDYFKIRSPADLYENVENFQPVPLQDLMGEMGAIGGGKGGGPGMLPMGMPKPKGFLTTGAQ